MEVSKGIKQANKEAVPSDWMQKPIGEDIDLLTGFPFPSNQYAKSGIRLLRGSNVKRGVTDWSDDITQYWEKLTTDIKEYALQEGDIVIAMDGSLVGRSFARLTGADLPALLLQRVARIRTKKIDAGYLKEFVCSDYFTKHCDAVKTSSAIPHISPNDIRSFVIPVPPTLEEQTAIATALSDADALISSLEKLIAKKRNIKQGAMQQLLQPKEGWEVKKLGEVSEIFRGGSPRPIEAFLTTNPNGINWIKIGDVGKGAKYIESTAEKIIAEGMSRSRYVHEGDFLLSNSMSFGRPYILKTDGCIHDGWLAIQNYQVHFDREFLYYLLGSQSVLVQYKAMASGSSVLNLNKEIVKNVLVAFPGIDEQVRIASILADMDNEIAVLESKLEKCQQIKQGMMQQLLTGKIRLV